MVPESGRIPKFPIQILSKMLQTFTLSYPDSNKIGPAFFILFTNFSRFEKDQDLNDDPFWVEDTPVEKDKNDHQTKTLEA